MALREMVEELAQEAFESDRKPKLMAMKVTKVEPLEGPAEDMESPEEAMSSEAEACPECGATDCLEHEAMEEPKAEMADVKVSKMTPDSPELMKLRKLLGK